MSDAPHVSATVDELQLLVAQQNSPCKQGAPLFRGLIVVILYLAIGVIFYHSQEPWTVVDSLYFSVVTISTVGYGDLTPSSSGSKVFTIFYIFFGIVYVFGEIASAITGCLAKAETSFLEFVDRWDPSSSVSGRQLGMSGKAIDLSGNGMADFIEPPGPLIFWCQRMAPWVTIATLFQLVSAGIFCALDSKLFYGDAFYHSFVTATTVGYGDVPLSSQASRGFATAHIMCSVTLFAAIVGRVQELAELRQQEMKRKEVLLTDLDPDTMKSIDRNANGVEKYEFVIAMLTRFGVELCGKKLHWDDIMPLLAQFESADVTKTGILNEKDLEALAVRKRKNVIAARSRSSQVSKSRGWCCCKRSESQVASLEAPSSVIHVRSEAVAEKAKLQRMIKEAANAEQFDKIIELTQQLQLAK